MSPVESESRLHIGLDVHKDSQDLDRQCSITVNTWLEVNARGFLELKLDGQSTILHFLLLWSLFEKRVLDLNGSVNAIESAAMQWEKDGLLTNESFEPEFSYFRNRYFACGKFTTRFKHLRFRDKYSRDIVKKVLQNMDANPDELATAILIIIYRIRNNLFHGVKWSEKLHRQLRNFNHANTTLIKAIKLQEKITKK